jgi:hypothetical protein
VCSAAQGQLGSEPARGSHAIASAGILHQIAASLEARAEAFAPRCTLDFMPDSESPSLAAATFWDRPSSSVERDRFPVGRRKLADEARQTAH